GSGGKAGMGRVADVLIPQGEIARRVRELGADLARDLTVELEREGSAMDAPGRIVLMPVLTGAVVFVADLIRHMPLMMSMELVSVSSYPGATTESKGAALRGALPKDLAGRHVVIVDDIYDTGQTLSLLQTLIAEQKPASVRTCVLLSKERERLAEAKVEYVGFEIPNAFVVGYGLDYDGFYRNLPEIVVLGEEPE
ncbi:MAG: hypoxanthine phosphoribosyltransferase, partial [Planctomycetota bacterium]|nr:hypoxanthine phosphoribosyltransferase [Planctomycetota bacterium]